jgi:hypothetical protein
MAVGWKKRPDMPRAQGLTLNGRDTFVVRPCPEGWTVDVRLISSSSLLDVRFGHLGPFRTMADAKKAAEVMAGGS